MLNVGRGHTKLAAHPFNSSVGLKYFVIKRHMEIFAHLSSGWPSFLIKSEWLNLPRGTPRDVHAVLILQEEAKQYVTISILLS